MATIFASGNVPNPHDTRWMILQRILGAITDGGGGGGGVSNQLLQGDGAPGAAPATPASPAYYSDRLTGQLYVWNTVTQAWE